MRLNELSNKITKSIPVSNRDPMVYVQRAKVMVKGNKIVFINAEFPGGKEIPVATTACLLLGPGTSVTNEAVKIIARRDCCLLFCGGGGLPINCYSGNYRSPQNLLNQAALMLDKNRRLEAAKKLLKKRNEFLSSDMVRLDEDEISKAESIQSVFLIEARWARSLYKQINTKIGVHGSNDLIKLANFMCYGLVTPVVIGLGLNPNIGIMHGPNRGGGLIFDIADLIKPVCAVLTSAKSVVAQDNENSLKRDVIAAFNKGKYKQKLISTIEDLYGMGR